MDDMGHNRMCKPDNFWTDYTEIARLQQKLDVYKVIAHKLRFYIAANSHIHMSERPWTYQLGLTALAKEFTELALGDNNDQK
jgi:hypothetical protein